MFLKPGGWGLLGSVAMSLILSNCAIQNYPGHPGVRTNGFAKIDMEAVDEAGLWVYEITYDNSPSGEGVEQIVTKLYPGALTYTSNVRTNSDGTSYRHKFPYKGAKVQMISLPKEATVILPPDSQVVVMVDYELSMDEVDDRNLAEENLFSSRGTVANVIEETKQRWNLLKAGEFQDGKLLYRIHRIKLGNEALDFSSDPIKISTTLSQTGVLLNVSAAQKQKMRNFLNEKFPKGFHGQVSLFLADGTSYSVWLGLNTLETLQASGKKIVIKDLSSIQPAAE